jgi:hypothetical protein
MTGNEIGRAAADLRLLDWLALIVALVMFLFACTTAGSVPA